jgi:hypothetical protein
MNSPSSPAPVVAFSEPSCSDGHTSGTSSGIPTAVVSSPSELEMGFSMTRPSLVATSEILFQEDMLTVTKEWLTWYRRAFRAKNFPSQTTSTPAKAQPELDLKTSGLQQSKSFDVSSLGLSSSKTSSDFSAPMDTSAACSRTWPRRGMMLDGKLFLDSTSEPLTSAAESGLQESDDGSE